MPSTVALFTDEGEGRVLAADFDVDAALAQGLRHEDAVALVAWEAAALAELVERCGGRAVTVRSPSGGRHVWVRWQRLLPRRELTRLTRALAIRFTTLDVRPMCSSGQIRPPGAMHKTVASEITGYVLLTVPVEEAEQVLRRPCGPSVWLRLHQELTAELAAVDNSPAGKSASAGDEAAAADSGPGGAGRTCPACDQVVDVPLDENGHPWLPRKGGPRPLPPGMETLARHGDWERRGARSASEPRLGLLNSMAAAGLRHGDVVARMRAGDWAGLERLLESRRASNRSRRLRWDWWKAVVDTAMHRHARSCNTSPSNPSTTPAPPTGATGSVPEKVGGSGEGDRGGLLYKVDSFITVAGQHNLNMWGLRTPAPEEADERVLNCWQEILRWRTCVWVAERDPERVARWGRAAPTIRMLLRGMAVAARMSGSTTPAFGVRSLSELVGPDYTTISRHLRFLREEDDPLVVLEEAGRGKEADRYRLVVPAVYRAQARWIRWRGGHIDILHPAFHELGAVAGLVFEALSSWETGSSEVARAALLSRSATVEALRLLAGYGLAVRERGGWLRGGRPLSEVAAELGADDELAERRAQYREHRRIWHELVDSWEQPASRSERPVDATYGQDAPWPSAPDDHGQEGAFDDVGAAEDPERVVPRPLRDGRAWPETIPGRRDREAPEQLELFLALAG
ncbi:helix-turn-helix domain-containing protein [Nonomuraea sp. NPDC026600]|uniref:helix-turn-helix domain-containing protein n=1 Tax=Nonomuraea sp. NPDC026600 TaxID=3155363 RepID=UPI0033FF38D8